MQWKDNGGGDYEQAPVGTHVARCVRLIDIGTQENEYEGRKSSRRQVVIGWELPEELMIKGESAGQPFLVTRFYTQSLNEKSTLRKDLITWRGRDFTPDELAGFDAQNILGVPCLVSITTNDQTGKSRVSGVMKLTKGIKPPKQVNPTLYFSLDPEEFDLSTYEGLSEGYKRMIEASPEFAEAMETLKPKGKKAAKAAAKPAPVDDPAEWPEEDGPELDFSEDEDDTPDF
jgi:hypothetical protein